MQKLQTGGAVIDSRVRGSRSAFRKLLLASVAFTAAAVVGLHGSAHAEDVDITTSTNAGANLDTFAGSTARVFPGVTVDNTLLGSTGISATTQAWTLTNQGTVTGSNSIKFTQGGAVTNSAGAQINAGLSGIVLSTFNAGGAGTVDNFGTITATVEGVTLKNGGTVTNYLGGTISTTGGNNAVSVGQGSSRTVVNSGEIHADKTTGYSTGVLVQGGAATLTNNSTGIITGGYNGIYANGSAPLTFTNNGSITSVRGPAVEARGGGTFTNTGTIQSGNDGMLVAGANPATVINSGTIGSTGTGRSIAFSGASTHTLNLLTGSVLTGNVQGGTGTDNLVLQGTGTESIAKFLAFETLSMQGADWTLTGTGTFTTSTTVTSGVLRVNGQLTSPTVTVAVGGTLGGNGTVVGSSLTNNGVLEGTGGDTLALNIAIANGGTIRANGGNVNTNTGFTGTGTASTSGTGVLTVAANSTVSTLLNNGSSANALTLGTSNITVSGDYNNASFGTGNSFNHRSNVTGGGLILAAGDVNQAITGAVTGGTTASPVLNFGSVRVGDNVSQNYQIANTGTTGPVLRGAIQTAANGGNITDSRLSGTGVTAGNFNPIATGSNSGSQVVTFNATNAGALTGQAVHIQNNFDNVQNQTIQIQGAAFNVAAGNASSPAQVTNQRTGGSNTALVTVANTAAAGSFSEDLIASIGGSSGAASGSGSITGRLAGSNNTGSGAISVAVNTATAGAKTGTVTLDYQTAGAVNGVSNGLGVASVGSQAVTVNGNVYQLAQGNLNNTSLNFGTVQVGQTVNQALSISNIAAGAAGFVEDLNTSFGASNGTGAGQISGVGSISGLAAGGTNASNLVVNVNTSTAGAINGGIAVNYSSAGAVNGVSNGLGVLGVGSQNFGVQGTIQAVANVIDTANPVINTAQPINLGNVRIGAVSPSAFVSVTNQASGNQQAALNASITGNAPITASGSFNLLSPGATNNTGLQVGLNTAAAGAINGTATIAFVSDANNVGNCAPNCQMNLASQNVSVTGNVYRLANPTLNTGNVTLAARVGDASPSAGISVTNSSPDSFTEGLNVTRGSTAAGFSSSGGIANLSTGGTDASSIQVALNTGVAGSFSGTQALNLVSTGAGTTGAADVSVGSTLVNLAGKVYQQAVAQVNTLAVNFGIVHRGDAVAPVAVSVSNAAPVAGLNDVLRGSLGGASGPFSASGNLGAGIAAGATDGSSLTVGLNTGATGVFNGSATASLLSHNADMADLALGNTLVSLSAQVNDFANADLRKTGGDGSLSRSALNIVLDFGNVVQGSGLHTSSLDVFNNVIGPADLLDGLFNFIDTNDFLFSGFNPFANLAAGDSQSGLSVAFDTTTLGGFSDTLTLASLGHNASGYSGGLSDVTFLIRGNVIAGGAVPEPESLLLMAIGMVALLAARRRRVTLH